MALVFASPFLLANMFMRLDLPTLLRPMNANSGRESVGHCDMLADDVMKVVFKVTN